ncbi:MAG: hypothetical protein KAS39_06325 [Actinomycetia bacterium]|nr:hypothetical protein [Actinomycetes bacterium]
MKTETAVKKELKKFKKIDKYILRNINPKKAKKINVEFSEYFKHIPFTEIYLNYHIGDKKYSVVVQTDNKIVSSILRDREFTYLSSTIRPASIYYQKQIIKGKSRIKKLMKDYVKRPSPKYQLRDLLKFS